MRVVVNALPISNFSGRNVVRGHLANARRALDDDHEFIVLHHRGNRTLREDFRSGFECIDVGDLGAGWGGRLTWELTCLPGLLEKLNADLLVTTSGALTPRVSVPQWVLAQNPWCFFPRFHRSLRDRVKAMMQRRGYRRAQRCADAMLYLSDYLKSMYVHNAGCEHKASSHDLCRCR